MLSNCLQRWRLLLRRNCIESGDDLDPVLWSAFGRAGWVDVVARLTDFFFFIANSVLAGA